MVMYLVLIYLMRKQYTNINKDSSILNSYYSNQLELLYQFRNAAQSHTPEKSLTICRTVHKLPENSQDQGKQCEAQNFNAFIRPNIQGGSVTNEIFNEKHSGLPQAAFINIIYLQRYSYIPVTNI
jgi:hypothetical protein